MKTFLPTAAFAVIAAMGSAALSASSAMASPTGSRPSNTLDVQEVRDRAPLHPRAAESFFKSIRGAYNMDDGTILHIYRDDNAYVAQVTGQAPVPVAATKNGKFVSPDGAIEIRFLQNSGGMYSDVVLSKPGPSGVSVASSRRSNDG